jgi:hypothetical protein
VPDLFSSCATVRTRGCRAEEVTSHPRFPSVHYASLTSAYRVLRFCDLALHSAADSGQKVTDKANERFEKATRVVCRYFIRWWVKILVASKIPLTIPNSCSCLSAGITILPQKGPYTARLSFGDFTFPIGPSLLQTSEDKWNPKMMIKFVLLRSPLAALQDPETVIVHRTHRSTSVVILDNLIYAQRGSEPNLPF